MKHEHKHKEGKQPTPAPTPPEEAAVETQGAATACAEQGEASASRGTPADPVAELQGRVAELEDKVLRARAEMQNVQKRAANERQDAIRFANAELMRGLLSVLDDFERSIEAARGATDPAAIREGEQMIYNNFLKALREHGLEEVESLGKAFNPAEHEALMQQAGSDKPAGTILEVAARGWRLRDRVIRPAKVIIAK